MKASILELQEEYNHYVDIHNIQRNRQRPNVMARFAFMVAARELYTTLEIARVTGKDHATVIHATKSHEMNLRFDSSYMKLFNESCTIIEKLRGSEIGTEKWQLTKHNALLQQRLDELREEMLELRTEVRNKDRLIKEMKHEYELSDWCSTPSRFYSRS